MNGLSLFGLFSFAAMVLPLCAVLDFAAVGFATCAVVAAGGWLWQWRARRFWQLHAKELAAEKEQHRNVFDGASEGIVITDGDTGKVLRANRAAASLLGWSQEEMVGRHHTEFYAPERREEMEQRFRMWMQKRSIGIGEAWPCHRSGEAIPVELRVSSFEASGRRFLQATARDLRRERVAREAVRASEARFHALFDNVPVAVLEKDYTAAAAWLKSLREEGVSDLRAYLQDHPEALAAQFVRTPVTAANRAALKRLGVPDVAAYNRELVAEVSQPILRTFQCELESLWQGRYTLSCALDPVQIGSERRLGGSLLHWSVPVLEGKPDLRRVLLAFTDLSELHAAEERLRASEERSRLALHGFNAGIWEYNFATDASFFSEQWKQMLGYGAQEIGERREEWMARVHPEDRPAVRSALESHLRGDSTYYESEHRLRCKDGRYIWVHSRGQAVFDATGHPLRIVGAHADIDGRKRMEEALRASEARYRELVEHSPLSIADYDVVGIVAWLGRLRENGVSDLAAYIEAHPEEYQGQLRTSAVRGVNTEAMRLLCAPSKEHVLENIDAIVTADTEQMRRQTLLAIWEGRNEDEGETTFRRFDGKLVRVFYHWWVPTLEGRRDFARTQVLFLDLSNIKRAEDALADERERLDVTLRAMTESVITVDPSGTVQFINKAAEKLLGWEPGAAVGLGIDDVCALRDEKALSAIVLSGAPQQGVRVAELPPRCSVVTRNGGLALVEGRMASMLGTDGSHLGAVLVLHDVTERARLETELLRSTKLESLGILAGGIAHDFNNLLTIVMGNLTLAMFDTRVTTEVGHWLREAEGGVLRARDLTQQLLTFAKGGDPVRSAVELPDIVREATEFALHGAKARCVFDIAAPLWPADVDKGQIGQVVQNIVINAVQAMPEGGVLHVALRNTEIGAGEMPALRQGKYLKLSFADTGTGITPEHLERIFDPYFTTKQQGNGLGLATVYSIVKKHQGHIEAESELGRGSTFHIWLPAAQRPAEVPSPSMPVPTPQKRRRILLMDDEASICTLMLELLKRLGYEAKAVGDGSEVVREYGAARAAGRPFDVVILDLTVPGGMGGREALETLQKIDPDVRAIVSSGYSSDPVLANHRACGFRAMVAKPYRVNDLAKAIQSVLPGAGV